MWVPDSAEEIIHATENREINETSTFDVKASDAINSSKDRDKKEMARDIAAMSTDGGVILYGIGEDENDEPTVLDPFKLKGKKEKVSNITQTCIQPPPTIKVRVRRLEEKRSKGFIVVKVPMSPEAPHMVTKNDDNRYYGRNGPRNVRLASRQIERLFERRQRLRDDRQSLLEEFEEHATIKPEDERDQIGYLRIAMQPLVNRRDLLESVLTPKDKTKTMGNVRMLIEETEEAVVFSGMSSNSFDTTGKWEKKANGYTAKLGRHGENAEGRPRHKFRSDMWIGYNGGVYFNAGGIVNVLQRGPVFREVMAADRTTKFLNLMGRLYSEAGYNGPVDIALQISGIQGAASGLSNDPFFRNEIETDEVMSDVRTNVTRMTENPKSIGISLLERILDLSTQGNAEKVFEEPKDG